MDQPANVSSTNPPTRWYRSPAGGTLLLVSAYLLAAVFFLLNWNRDMVLGDEGVAAMGAWRIASGHMPYVDFFEIETPFSFLVTAAAFKLVGASVAALRATAFLQGLLLIFLADRLACRFTSSAMVRVTAILFLTVFGVYYWPIPSHHWTVDVAQLAAVLALLKALDSADPRLWGAVSGGLCALGVFSLQDQGAYLVLALLLLFFPWLKGGAHGRRLFGFWVAGGLAVTLVFAVYLLPRASISSLWEQWVAFPATQYSQLEMNRSNLIASWRKLLFEDYRGLAAHMPYYFASALVLNAFLTLLPVLAAYTLAVTAAKKKLPFKVYMPLACLGAAGIGCLMHRLALSNLVWAAPALLVTVALGAGWSAAHPKPAIRIVSRSFVAVLLAACLVYAGVQSYFGRAAATWPVVTPAGTYRTGSRERAGVLQDMVNAVVTNVPKGAPLFPVGFIPLANFVTGHPSPSRFNFFLYPGYHTDAQANEAISALQENAGSYVLQAIPLPPGSELQRYLQERYRIAWAGDGFLLLAPKQD